MKTFVIEGNASDIHTEIQEKLCPQFNGYGRNLDALWDILRGGFHAFELGEPIHIIIKNANLLPPKMLQVFKESEMEMGHIIECI